MSFEISSRVQGKYESTVVTEWLMKGTHEGSFFGAEPTNREVEISGVDIILIRNEKITSIKSYYDTDQFNKQLGL